MYRWTKRGTLHFHTASRLYHDDHRPGYRSDCQVSILGFLPRKGPEDLLTVVDHHSKITRLILLRLLESGCIEF